MTIYEIIGNSWKKKCFEIFSHVFYDLLIRSCDVEVCFFGIMKEGRRKKYLTSEMEERDNKVPHERQLPNDGSDWIK